MRLEDFNAMSTPAATATLRQCAGIEAWVEGLVIGRPYADLDALLAAAAAATDDWTDAEVEAALADHPRIGERVRGRGVRARMSRREQAGADTVDTELLGRLDEGNRRYEARFGRIYLVRAAGRTPEDLLGLLEQRLMNDPETERRVTKEQLAEIAMLRLEGLFT
jgi:2-oxo-4-hydroxy-4-carboxy-5-ureidoimidazoline decarboxylase